MSLPLIHVSTPAGVRAAFTTRAGGVSTGAWAGLNLGSTTGDDRDAVRRNRSLLCDAMGLDAERMTLGFQVHGAEVRRVTAPTRPGRFTGALSGWPESDGLVTTVPGIGLAVLGADCLPVLLWRSDATGVAAVHAGWRGLVGGVLEAAVAALGLPQQTSVAIGAGVGPCCYPVEADLRRRFADRFGAETVVDGAVHLGRAARIALESTGVTVETVVDACTSCDAERFYSYRRDGTRTGRHAGVISRTAIA